VIASLGFWIFGQYVKYNCIISSALSGEVSSYLSTCSTRHRNVMVAIWGAHSRERINQARSGLRLGSREHGKPVNRERSDHTGVRSPWYGRMPFGQGPLSSTASPYSTHASSLRRSKWFGRGAGEDAWETQGEEEGRGEGKGKGKDEGGEVRERAHSGSRSGDHGQTRAAVREWLQAP